MSKTTKTILIGITIMVGGTITLGVFTVIVSFVQVTNSRNHVVDSLNVNLQKKASVEYVNNQINNLVKEKERVHMTMWNTLTANSDMNTKEHNIIINTLNRQCKNDAERNKLLQELLESKKESRLMKDSLQNDLYNNEQWDEDMIVQPDSVIIKPCVSIKTILCLDKDSLSITKNQ